MNKYKLSTTSVGRECVESPKMLKKRLKLEKKKLRDFMALTDELDMNWEHRQTAVGTLYTSIVRLKKEMKRSKDLEKVKKGKKL